MAGGTVSPPASNTHAHTIVSVAGSFRRTSFNAAHAHNPNKADRNADSRMRKSMMAAYLLRVFALAMRSDNILSCFASSD
jgi:hypothetical protein